MNDLETRLHDVLRDRADDVDATPALWDRVADATTRRERRHAALTLAGALAAGVVVAVGGVALATSGGSAPSDVVVDPSPQPPAGIDPDPAPSGDGTTRPEGEHDPATSVAPGDLVHGDLLPVPVVVLDGEAGELLLVDPVDDVVAVLLDGWQGFEFAPAEVAVRPGSTPDDATVVVRWAGEGVSEIGWLRWRGEEVVVPYTPLLTAEDPRATVAAGALTWIADDTLAWIEQVVPFESRTATSTSLLVAPWTADPVAPLGPPARHDLAAVAPDRDVPVDLDLAGLRLRGAVGGQTPTLFVHTPEDTEAGFEVRLERRADGSYAPAGTARLAGGVPEGGLAVVDVDGDLLLRSGVEGAAAVLSLEGAEGIVGRVHASATPAFGPEFFAARATVRDLGGSTAVASVPGRSWLVTPDAVTPLSRGTGAIAPVR